jgi:hypothetical protein
MDKSFPARKAHANDMRKNSGSISKHFEHLRTAMARVERNEEEAPHKAGVGVTEEALVPSLGGLAPLEYHGASSP